MLPKGVSIKGQLSIPRAELNAAVDLAEKVLEVEMELDIADLKPTVFYSDSEDVLSWIKNDTPKEPPARYCMSRINRIRKVSSPNQWHYIPTKFNPADIGTRPISVKDLKASCWLTGPAFLRLEDPKTPTAPKTPKPETTVFFASVSSYFLVKNKHATEDLSLIHI